ncbi:phage shock protein G [Sodalis glossinidius str. 'morsitans']|uniref:Phage shock protein G n=1 Tax=Sodalis glossinidius (strain morsitans) TaxID=343509 RepID=A0A193QMR5_SODGM|nr:hypothetical protein [Sodalis glossinidius]CRL46456.1 phage shock protein G [Sodalis glossinidius str. 'morsitans']
MRAIITAAVGATLPFAIEESFMLEIFFVVRFFLMLVLNGISVLVALGLACAEETGAAALAV